MSDEDDAAPEPPGGDEKDAATDPEQPGYVEAVYDDDGPEPVEPTESRYGQDFIGITTEDPEIRRWIESTEGIPAAGIRAVNFVQGPLGQVNGLTELGQALSDVAASATESQPKQGAQTVDDLTPDEQADLENKQQDTKLKGRYANALLGMLAVQMIGADAIFVLFAAIGEHWKLQTSVIDVWLGATVVQMVTVVAIVVHYLFPNRDGKKD